MTVASSIVCIGERTNTAGFPPKRWGTDGVSIAVSQQAPGS